MKPLSIVSRGRRLCDVKISWPFPFSEMIFKSSPSRYSKIPESNSSIATVMDGLLYTTISNCKIETIFLMPSDSYWNGIAFSFFNDISWISLPIFPSFETAGPKSTTPIVRPGTNCCKTIFMLSIIFFTSSVAFSGIDAGLFNGCKRFPTASEFFSLYLKANGKAFILIKPSCCVSIIKSSLFPNVDSPLRILR